MDTDRPNFFAGPYIDRRAEAREAADWLEAALADARTFFILGRGTTHLIRKEPRPGIEFLSSADPVLRGLDPRRLVLLGWFKGMRCVLAEIDPLTPFEVPQGAAFEELRALAPGLPADEG